MRALVVLAAALSLLPGHSAFANPAKSESTASAIACQAVVMRAVSRIALTGAAIRSQQATDDDRERARSLNNEARSCSFQIAVSAAKDARDNDDLQEAAKNYAVMVRQVMDELPSLAVSASVQESQRFAERLLVPAWRRLEMELLVAEATE